MSSITGSCTESVASELFQKGIDQAQESQQREQSNVVKDNESKPTHAVSQNTAAEGIKGMIVDVFA